MKAKNKLWIIMFSVFTLAMILELITIWVDSNWTLVLYLIAGMSFGITDGYLARWIREGEE